MATQARWQTIGRLKTRAAHLGMNDTPFYKGEMQVSHEARALQHFLGAIGEHVIVRRNSMRIGDIDFSSEEIDAKTCCIRARRRCRHCRRHSNWIEMAFSSREPAPALLRASFNHWKKQQHNCPDAPVREGHLRQEYVGQGQRATSALSIEIE